MKTKRFLGAAVVLLASFLAVGCTDVATDGTVSGGSANTLEISLGMNSDGTFARTIEPDALTTTGVSSYKIEGTASTGDSIALTAITVSDGKATLNLDPAIWSLTLHAYNASDKELLRGYASVDMRKGGSSVTFTLSSTDVTTDGGVSLKCQYAPVTGFGAVASFTAGLYDTQTGKPVMTDAETPATTVVTDSTAADLKKFYQTAAGADATVSGGTSDAEGYTYAAATVAPGTYTFGVTFCNTAGDEIGYYSDYVLIEPGRTTESTVLMQNVIATVPTAPASFTAKMVENSGKDGYFNVLFDWTDSSTNETYFKIVVKKYASLTDASPTEYATYDSSFIESSDRVSGSLFAGNKSCVVRLPAGCLFDAEIYAVNKAGASAARARSATTDAVGSGYVGYAAPGTGRINCVQLSYNLYGGTLTTASNTTYTGTTYVEYAVYTGSNIALKTINAVVASGGTQTYPTLVYKIGSNSYDFQYWVDNTDGTTKKTETNGFNNIYVKACYNSATVTIASLVELESDRVSATVCASDATPAPATDDSCKDGTVDASTTKKITLAVLAPTTGQHTFSQYRFILNSVIMSETAADNTSGKYTSYTFATNKIESGTYQVTVAGYDETTRKWYSNTFTVTVSK